MIGEITQDNLYLLLPSKVSWLACMLEQKHNLSHIEALKAVYASDAYRRLEQEHTKMWHLGPVDLFREMGL